MVGSIKALVNGCAGVWSSRALAMKKTYEKKTQLPSKNLCVLHMRVYPCFMYITNHLSYICSAHVCGLLEKLSLILQLLFDDG